MNQIQKNILLIFGGKSTEHEISVVSIKTIYPALVNNGFNVILLGISKNKGYFKYIDNINIINKTIEDNDGLDANIIIKNSNHYLMVKEMQLNKHVEIFKDKDLEQNSNYNIEILQNKNLQQNKLYKIDFAFPYIIGTQGEDGKIQGLLDMLNLQYTGSSLSASSIAIDKDLTRYISNSIIKSPAYLVYYDYEINIEINFEDIIKKLEVKSNAIIKTLIIKPARCGSSVGISKAKNQQELLLAIKEALLFDNKVIIEQYIENCVELEVAILGNCKNPIIAKNIAELELKSGHEFYSYAAKYEEDGAHFKIPANITLDTVENLKNIASLIYKKIQANGLARIDFLMQKDTKEIYFNEINTAPGFTEISMFPALWKNSGLSIEEIVLEITKHLN